MWLKRFETCNLLFKPQTFLAHRTKCGKKPKLCAAQVRTDACIHATALFHDLSCQRICIVDLRLKLVVYTVLFQ